MYVAKVSNIFCVVCEEMPSDPVVYSFQKLLTVVSFPPKKVDLGFGKPQSDSEPRLCRWPLNLKQRELCEVSEGFGK